MSAVSEIIMYSTDWCGYCQRARNLLERKGATYREIKIDEDIKQREEMMQRSGRRTVPQIFIGERHVGGYDDLAALDRAGELDKLLAQLPK
ncbi:glutaredoxin 3 [Steroidobacter sp. S1-65]|uniref:Glutaredoxin n=1 Tax=Steroidobacter gossypii TaxID=2805490 RepID=A0ABS1WT16_9GAMM|nr:glutaredoxin 3 [Steroidobacter gossypii]MBM0104127.1 glutaredoxin 3 [Steroidobacter gossypii]